MVHRAQHGVVVDGFFFFFLDRRLVNGSVLKVML